MEKCCQGGKENVTQKLKAFLKDFLWEASTNAYQVEDGKVPVKVINMRDYGTVKGANVLKRAIEIIEEHR